MAVKRISAEMKFTWWKAIHYSQLTEVKVGRGHNSAIRPWPDTTPLSASALPSFLTTWVFASLSLSNNRILLKELVGNVWVTWRLLFWLGDVDLLKLGLCNINIPVLIIMGNISFWFFVSGISSNQFYFTLTLCSISLSPIICYKAEWLSAHYREHWGKAKR